MMWTIWMLTVMKILINYTNARSPKTTILCKVLIGCIIPHLVFNFISQGLDYEVSDKLKDYRQKYGVEDESPKQQKISKNKSGIILNYELF